MNFSVPLGELLAMSVGLIAAIGFLWLWSSSYYLFGRQLRTYRGVAASTSNGQQLTHKQAKKILFFRLGQDLAAIAIFAGFVTMSKIPSSLTLEMLGIGVCVIFVPVASFFQNHAFRQVLEGQALEASRMTAEAWDLSERQRAFDAEMKRLQTLQATLEEQRQQLDAEAERVVVPLGHRAAS